MTNLMDDSVSYVKNVAYDYLMDNLDTHLSFWEYIIKDPQLEWVIPHFILCKFQISEKEGFDALLRFMQGMNDNQEYNERLRHTLGLIKRYPETNQYYEKAFNFKSGIFQNTIP